MRGLIRWYLLPAVAIAASLFASRTLSNRARALQAPPIVAASLKVLDLLRSAKDLRERLSDNTQLFRRRMTEEKFEILPGEHPIVPVMVGDAALAGRMAATMLEKGVYVVGFSYPVVPHGKARIRTQVSAAHSPDELERAVRAFVETRREVAQ